MTITQAWRWKNSPCFKELKSPIIRYSPTCSRERICNKLVLFLETNQSSTQIISKQMKSWTRTVFNSINSVSMITAILNQTKVSASLLISAILRAIQVILISMDNVWALFYPKNIKLTTVSNLKVCKNLILTKDQIV